METSTHSKWGEFSSCLLPCLKITQNKKSWEVLRILEELLRIIQDFLRILEELFKNFSEILEEFF